MGFFEATHGWGGAKSPTALGFLKIKLFWKNSYNVIISDNDVTNKFLSCGSSYIVGVVMWPKFGNSNISMKEVIITSIL